MKAYSSQRAWVWILGAIAAAAISTNCSSDDSSDDSSSAGHAGAAGSHASAGGSAGHTGGTSDSAGGDASSAAGEGDDASAGKGGRDDAGSAGEAGSAGIAGAGAIDGVLEVSATALSFDVECPHPPIADPQTVTLTNRGGTALTWSAKYDSSQVTITPSSSKLEPGEHVDVSVAPAAITSTKAPGSNIALAPIQLSSDVKGSTPKTISLSEAASGTMLAQIPALSFGRVPVGTETTKSVGPFGSGISLKSSDDSVVLSGAAPKQDGTWDVTFLPSGEGLKTATLTLGSQTTCLWPPNTITVSGTGVYDPTCTSIPDGAPCATDGLCALGKCVLQALLTGQPANAISLLPFTGVVATGTIDPKTNATLSATIDWGDGSTTLGTVTDLLGVLSISGSHTYAQPGSFNAVVTLLDSNSNLSLKAPFTVTAS